MSEVERPYDEQYDTMMEVEQDPTGAMMAIQALVAECDTLRAQLATARADALEEAENAVIKSAPRFGLDGPRSSEEYGESEGFRLSLMEIRALKETTQEASK